MVDGTMSTNMWSRVSHWPNLKAALDVLEGHFSSQKSDEDEIELVEFGVDGGRATLDWGRLPWGEYSVLYVYERELEWGGTFRDVIRVNLSLGDQAAMLMARWPRGTPASKERLIELLAGFELDGSGESDTPAR